MKRFIATGILAASVSACSLLPEPHRIEITQGTVIEQEEVNKLKLGMTREQVKFILGTPSIQDIYTPNRWDYIHYVDRKGEELLSKRLTAFFDNDALVRVEGDFSVAN